MRNNDISLREKNIVFTGFMGVGKTSIGKAVAKKLYRDFVDIDEEIEKKHHMPTTEIFKNIGEQAFREEERNMIAYFCKSKLKIISVGGGAFLHEETRKICLSECIVFFLDLSWESWQDRISLIIDSRPVLQGKSIDEIKTLFHERQAIYEEHHFKIKTDNLVIDEVADNVVHALKTDWETYEPNV